MLHLSSQYGARRSGGARSEQGYTRKVRLIAHQSRGLSMVETEESAEAVAPLHGGGRALWRCPCCRSRLSSP